LSKLDLQYDLVNYTPANAAPPEANFNRIEQHTNQELIERDGTVAMRAQLRLVGDPVNDLDAAPKQYVDQVLPIGIVMMYGGAGAPPGGRWAVCNGAELESATYPQLFAIIANNFSPGGTPAGRFHLPNLTDRFAVGTGSIGGLGAVGGSRDSTLPAHAHSVDIWSSNEDVNHVHGFSGRTDANGNHYHLPSGGSGVFIVRRGDAVVSFSPGPGVGYVEPDRTTDAGAHDHGYGGTTGGVNVFHRHAVNGTSGQAGAAATNTNLPPYIGMTHVMRVS
jgi:microcystin-dependent protein